MACKHVTRFYILILSLFFLPLNSSGDWDVTKIPNGTVDKGNYDIDNKRFVWEGFDGNDWEIYYYRPFDQIKGTRYNLIMHKGEGSEHKKGGITKVGGTERRSGVCYDYEGLCQFNLKAFTGPIKKARLHIIFDADTCLKPECEKKCTCQYKCHKKYSCKTHYKHYFTPCYKYFYIPYKKFCYKPYYNSYKKFSYSLYSRYSKGYSKYSYNPYSFSSYYSMRNRGNQLFNKVYYNPYFKTYGKLFYYSKYNSCSKKYYTKCYFGPYFKSCVKSKLKCYQNDHCCKSECFTKNIVVYNENKGPWEKKSVTYNSFNHCPWNDKIGEIYVPNKQIKSAYLENEDLRDLVQMWVDDPASNKGLVLTADFGHNYTDYLKVKKVYLYVSFENKILQLTDNDIDEYDPRIDKHYITWGAWDGNDSEVFFWNGHRVIQITDNDMDEYNASISSQQIVWEGFDGTNWDIYRWKNGVTKNISDNGFDHYNPKIDKGKVTWNGGFMDGADDEIFYFDGENTIQITDNDYDDWFPEIDSTKITWQGFDGTDTEIYLWDAHDPIITAITDNTTEDAYPKISGSDIVWRNYDGTDWEIVYWDGTQTIQVTDNTTDDYDPTIDKGTIVWSGHDGVEYDIYSYDSTGTELVFDNTDNDYVPLISKNNVLWKTYEYDSTNLVFHYELYLGKKIID